MTEPIAWPDWLEELEPPDRVAAITQAVADCHEDHGCGGSREVHRINPETDAPHLTSGEAETLLLRLLDETREQAPVLSVTPGLRDRIDAALQDSMDACSRCKACGVQVDAVMAVLGADPGLAAARSELCPEIHPAYKTPCTWLAQHGGKHRDASGAEWLVPLGEPETPPARLANVEVKGFRDLGVVAVSEITLAGVPFLHAESRDGSAADFPASSVHFIAWLPPGSPWPEKPKAIAPRPATFGHPADDDDQDDYAAHTPGCRDADCSGECADEVAF